MYFNNRGSESVSVGSYRDMEGKARKSNRPLIIVTVVFVIIVVIVGAVVWKVTKDAYEGDDSVKSKTVTDGGDNGGDDSQGEKEEISEEELRRHPWKRLRLPRSILPVHYDVTMYPDFYDDHGEFYGNETILLNVTSPSKYLFIHIQTDYNNITHAEVTDNATGNAIPIKEPFVYKPNQFFVIEGNEEFNGLVNVHLQFEGTLTKAIVGIYKSTYRNSKTNEKRYLATSKFEPTFARRAFPCLDEPNMKAKFTITLIHKGDPYIALSNMDVDTKSTVTINGEQLVATRFHPSVKMSTYLVCFIVCDFQSISTTSKMNTTIRVFATPDKQDQTQYALDMAKHTLDLYEEKFEIKYPLPKQDLIAIPDFVSGAMEHWGLITFRDSALLYNESTSTLSNKKRVATVVAHEMAHQWFGNLVTMDWWNDLWLNEGFASYVEYIGTDDKEKDWDMDSQFVIDDLFRAMGLDDVINTHPIIVTVRDPSEITSVFDAISYSKGASVIRMLEGIMGSDNFFKGVAKYLEKYKWGNARTDDLWNSLTEVDTSIKVKDIMDTWTIQDGYPYVNVTMATTANGKTTLVVSQHRFLSDPKAEYDPAKSPFGCRISSAKVKTEGKRFRINYTRESGTKKYKWYISLDYRYPGGEDAAVMNKTEEITFEVPFDLRQDESWIKFNKDMKGFYRVLYPDIFWYRLADYLMKTPAKDYELSASDRAGILGDAFELAAAGKIYYDVPLNLIQYLENRERHYVPWQAASDGLGRITSLLLDDPGYEMWQAFRLKLVGKVLNSLTNTDSFLNSQLYSLMYSMTASVGKSDLMDEIKQKYRNWLDKGEKPDVRIRGVIYNTGMEQLGTNDDWNSVWDNYVNETSSSEKSLLLRCLASTTRPNLIAKFLDRALRLEGIRRQDFFTAINLIGYNSRARHMVWDWMRENYSVMEKQFTVMDRYFGRMAYYLVRHFKTPLKLQEVKDFFSQHPNEGTSARYRKMALESISSNIQWLARNKDDILRWVEEMKNYKSIDL